MNRSENLASKPLEEASRLPFHRPCVGEEEIQAVVETLRSGWLTMGPRTAEFEEAFAHAVGARYAIAVASATAGLHLAFDALDLHPGDEVLVPTMTFASTASTVIHAGGTPRLVDCEPETMNMSVAHAERLSGPRTRAIVPVHFAGHPCRMTQIQGLATARDLVVVEDAAHAVGAAYRGRKIGSVGRLTVFSFYATKSLTTGEGGMVTTDDAELSERIRSRRLHGMTRDAWRRYGPGGSWRYDVSYPGFKYNMTDSAAAMGLVQLRRLPDMQRRRAEIAARYRDALAGVEAIQLPACEDDVVHAWHLFVIRVRTEFLDIGRDDVIAELAEAGIGTSVHFIPLHQHSYYRDVLGYRPEQFPNATAAAERNISLPIFPDMTDEAVDRVADTLRGIMRRHGRRGGIC